MGNEKKLGFVENCSQDFLKDQDKKT